MVILLPTKSNSEANEIDILKGQCPLVAVLLLRLDEMEWVLAPVPTRGEMVRSVVAIIKAVIAYLT